MAISTIGTDGLAASAVTNPKLASGVPSTAKLPAGTVLQVVKFTTVPSNIYTTSTSYVDSGMLDVFITPSVSGSKIIVRFENFIPHCNPYNGNIGGSAKIYRSVAGASSEPVNPSNHDAGWYINAGNSTNWWDYYGYMEVMDSPSYTVGQQIKYTVWCRMASNNSSAFYFNHMGGLASYTDTPIVTGIAMEIAA